MIGIVAGAFLVGMLILVHFSSRRRPIPSQRPLNVDRGLDLPWAGHASNVFSLTALFGGYIAILIVLGLPALFGIAIGSVLAILFMRNAIIRSGHTSFHEFLVSRRFSVSEQGNGFYWLLLTITQIGFAASEVFILREIAVHAFNMTTGYANIFAGSVALIGYFYCLLGGYFAVFRTDVVQLFFMATMCVIACVYAFAQLPGMTPSSQNPLLSPLLPTVWCFGLKMLEDLHHLLNFLVGLVAGSSLLLSSPDTWKRIFLTSVHSGRGKYSFWILVFSGMIPFLLILPSVALMPPQSLLDPRVFESLAIATQHRVFLFAITLGMMASFLSTFDSALISATHLLLARSEVRAGAENAGLARYHYLLGGSCIAAVAGAFMLLKEVSNPYFIGLVLLGCYSILGGTIVGTSGLGKPKPGRGFAWGGAVAIVSWFLIIVSYDDVLTRALPGQMTAIPAASLFFLIAMASAKIHRWLVRA